MSTKSQTIARGVQTNEDLHKVKELLPDVGDVYQDTLFDQRVGVKHVDGNGQRSPCILLCSFERGANAAIPHERWIEQVGERFVKREVD